MSTTGKDSDKKRFNLQKSGQDEAQVPEVEPATEAPSNRKWLVVGVLAVVVGVAYFLLTKPSDNTVADAPPGAAEPATGAGGSQTPDTAAGTAGEAATGEGATAPEGGDSVPAPTGADDASPAPAVNSVSSTPQLVAVFAPGVASPGSGFDPAVISAAVAAFKSNSKHKFEAVGHASSDGDAARNVALSRERAEMLKAELVAAGIPEANVTVRGAGSDEPVGNNATFEGRSQNRRVDLRF
jgi:outer membrane protein OmpA-like peptidoglycan-associated protein